MKIGVFGGTFDPVHNGHINAFAETYIGMKLDKVIIVPTFISPFKKQAGSTDSHRLNMLKLAVEDYDFAEIDTFEIDQQKVTYTFDTLKYLKGKYPDDELYFIIGADSVPQLHTWDRIYDLFELVTFAAAYRPGYSNVIETACEQLGNIAREKIILLDTPEYAVSSTEIRKRIREGASLEGMVPEAVEEYIKKNQLYLG